MTTEDENVGGVGQGIEFSLEGDIIRRRQVATRAVAKRELVVLVVGDNEFSGYAIGMDDASLQLLDVAAREDGEVSSLAWPHIVAISDGRTYEEIPGPQKSVVDRRTRSFLKNASAWLRENWPEVYDRQEDHRRPGPPPSPTRFEGR